MSFPTVVVDSETLSYTPDLLADYARDCALNEAWEHSYSDLNQPIDSYIAMHSERVELGL